MADTANLVRALVALAQAKNEADPDSGTIWLKGLIEEASIALLAGDAEMTAVSFEGGSGSGSRSFKSADLLELCQLALEELTGTGPADVVQMDFSRRPVCT